MNTTDLIRKRCSIRQYLTIPVENEKIEYILEAARLAPSACNYQPWYFLIVTQQEGRRKITECYPREWMKEAPLYIVVCGDHSQSWKRPADKKDHLDVDAGIVTEHICLAATELGLGTCIVCNFDVPLLCEHFKLPESVEPIAIVPLAYPADPELFLKTQKKRKSIEEVIKRESF